MRTPGSSLTWIVPLAIVALLAVVWVIVGRTLRPVEPMRAQVATIGMTALDRRIPETQSGDEIARLAVTVNEMLTRLEHSVRHNSASWPTPHTNYAHHSHECAPNLRSMSNIPNEPT